MAFKRRNVRSLAVAGVGIAFEGAERKKGPAEDKIGSSRQQSGDTFDYKKN